MDWAGGNMLLDGWTNAAGLNDASAAHRDLIYAPIGLGKREQCAAQSSHISRQFASVGWILRSVEGREEIYTAEHYTRDQVQARSQHPASVHLIPGRKVSTFRWLRFKVAQPRFAGSSYWTNI
jgi:hypothetical protein